MNQPGTSGDNGVDLNPLTQSLSGDFRKYLKRGSVVDNLTKLLVNLHNEKKLPEDPNIYLCHKWAGLSGIPLIEKMKADILLLDEEIKKLELTIFELESELKNNCTDSDEQIHKSTTNL